MTEPATPDASTADASTPQAMTGPTSFQVTVSVDNNHCHFYAICVQEAPEVFDLSVDGRIRYKAKPAAHLYEKVWNAARLCPMQAIHIEPGETITVPPVVKTPDPSAGRPDSNGQHVRTRRTKRKAS